MSLFNRAMKWLVPKLENWCERTGRTANITGKQGPMDVLLVRAFLFRSPLFCIYIHRFLRPDQDDPHDHPFDFLGYVVSGGYDEWNYTKYYNLAAQLILSKKKDRRTEGTWAYRPATHIHKVVVDQELPYDRRKEAVLTVIFRGRYKRDWNFYKLFGRPWIDQFLGDKRQKAIKTIWHEYLGVKSHSRK
jgi:hypothetical protein